MREHLARNAAAGLLGREAEVAELDRLLAKAANGAGHGLLIEGPPGIGKTSLVTEACERARRAAINVLSARGGELERDLAFGIVRQLFERPLASLPKRSRTRVSAGAAAPAVDMLDPSRQARGRPGGKAPDEASLLHSLYWLCSNLAEGAPMLVVIDDLQWADSPSRRWVAYLARRLEAHPLLLLLAWRTGEPEIEDDVLEALGREPRMSKLRPDPLDESSVSELVRRTFGASADDEFSRAFHVVGGGNPFVTVELIAEAAERRMPPTAQSCERIRGLGPEAVSRDVLRRISRLGPAAERVASAVAVLGTDADLGQVARLARLSPEEAAATADSLAEARVLRPERPLEFIHPVLRSVVYEHIPVGERSQGHMQAARMLAQAGQAEEAAIHILSAEGTGDEWVIETLRTAAATAHAPDAAAIYLKRALEEPPPAEERAELLLQLGRAEEASLNPAAIAHLAEAHRLGADPVLRARAGRALAGALFWSNRSQEAERTYSEVIAELRGAEMDATGEGRELRLLLQVDLHWAQLESGRLPPDAFGALRELAGQFGAGAPTPGERNVMACLAYVGTFAGATPEEVAEYGRRAREGGDPAEALSDARSFYAATWGLEFADRLELAEQYQAEALMEAEKRASLSGIAFARTALAIVNCRRGSLGTAGASARAAIDVARDQGIDWLLPLAGAALADVLIEWDELAEADRVISATEIQNEENDLSVAAFHRHNRARLRLAQRRGDDALADFLEAGRLMRFASHDQPAYYPWRSGAALAQLALGRRDAARPFVADELEMARSFGAPRSLGVSLRTCGLVEGGEASLRLLREAVDVLEESPAELERARAIVELGSAFRRFGKRNTGKELLLRGLDLADRCGSVVLAARAREELHTLGARPRRAAISGVASLTAGEERVARLAAEGMTNREIAQGLVVSPKTVEKQLGHAYRKLGISSRRQLREALATESR